MTPYTYERPDGTTTVVHFPFGEAPRSLPDGSVRVYGAVMKFTYGKQAFHGSTLGEQLEAQHKHWADEGRKVEYVGSRWV